MDFPVASLNSSFLWTFSVILDFIHLWLGRLNDLLALLYDLALIYGFLKRKFGNFKCLKETLEAGSTTGGAAGARLPPQEKEKLGREKRKIEENESEHFLFG